MQQKFDKETPFQRLIQMENQHFQNFPFVTKTGKKVDDF